MEMIYCPHCGAQNSSKRSTCYQCERELSGAPAKEPEPETVCADCIYAAIFPPPGQRLRKEDVWCTSRNEAVPSSQAGGDCYEPAFGWKREEILD